MRVGNINPLDVEEINIPASGSQGPSSILRSSRAIYRALEAGLAQRSTFCCKENIDRWLANVASLMMTKLYIVFIVSILVFLTNRVLNKYNKNFRMHY